MAASNDSQKKISQSEDEVIVVNGRKMLLRPDGSLAPLDKKKAFDMAARRVENRAPLHDERLNLADVIGKERQ